MRRGRRREAGGGASSAWRISVVWLHHVRAFCEQFNSLEGTCQGDPGARYCAATGPRSTSPCSPGGAARTLLRGLRQENKATWSEVQLLRNIVRQDHPDMYLP